MTVVKKVQQNECTNDETAISQFPDAGQQTREMWARKRSADTDLDDAPPKKRNQYVSKGTNCIF